MLVHIDKYTTMPTKLFLDNEKDRVASMLIMCFVGNKLLSAHIFNNA